MSTGNAPLPRYLELKFSPGRQVYTPRDIYAPRRNAEHLDLDLRLTNDEFSPICTGQKERMYLGSQRPRLKNQPPQFNSSEREFYPPISSSKASSFSDPPMESPLHCRNRASRLLLPQFDTAPFYVHFRCPLGEHPDVLPLRDFRRRRPIFDHPRASDEIFNVLPFQLAS